MELRRMTGRDLRDLLADVDDDYAAHRVAPLAAKRAEIDAELRRRAFIAAEHDLDYVAHRGER